LGFEAPIALPVHFKSAAQPVRHGRFAFRAATHEMFDRVGPSCLPASNLVLASFLADLSKPALLDKRRRSL
jgi:hypothetical protein